MQITTSVIRPINNTQPTKDTKPLLIIPATQTNQNTNTKMYPTKERQPTSSNLSIPNTTTKEAITPEISRKVTVRYLRKR